MNRISNFAHLISANFQPALTSFEWRAVCGRGSCCDSQSAFDDVEDRRLRADRLVQLDRSVVPDQAGNLAAGVIQVAETQRLPEAMPDAVRAGVGIYSRLQPLGEARFNDRSAKVAFAADADSILRRCAGVRSRRFPGRMHSILIGNVTHAVGARYHAGPAADALFEIHVHDSVGMLAGGTRRANIAARRFFTMHATDGEKNPQPVGCRQAARIDDTPPEASSRRPVHLQTNVLARLAADAFT